jgi:hypothetical protein
MKTLYIEIRLTDEEAEKLKNWEEDTKQELEPMIVQDVKDYIGTMGKRLGNGKR